MTCLWRPTQHNRNGRLDPWRHMVAEDLGLDLLKSEFDPLLLAYGIKVPRLSAEASRVMRSRNQGWFAGTIAGRKPRSPAQKAKEAMRGTVREKEAREEIRQILFKYSWLGQYRR